MREWSKDSKTTVAHMKGGDFFGSEKSTTVDKPTTVSIEFVGKDGSKKLLKKELKLKV
jgi:isocitrate dehydrogenase